MGARIACFGSASTWRCKFRVEEDSPQSARHSTPGIRRCRVCQEWDRTFSVDMEIKLLRGRGPRRLLSAQVSMTTDSVRVAHGKINAYFDIYSRSILQT